MDASNSNLRVGVNSVRRTSRQATFGVSSMTATSERPDTEGREEHEEGEEEEERAEQSVP